MFNCAGRNYSSAAAALLVGIAAPLAISGHLFWWTMGWPTAARRTLLDAGLSPRLAAHASVFFVYLWDYVIALAFGATAAILMSHHARWIAVWGAVGMMVHWLGWHLFLRTPLDGALFWSHLLPWQITVIPLAVLPTLLRRARAVT